MSCSNVFAPRPDTIIPFSPEMTHPPHGKFAASLIRPTICVMSFSASSPSSSTLTSFVGLIESQRYAVNMLKE